MSITTGVLCSFENVNSKIYFPGALLWQNVPHTWIKTPCSISIIGVLIVTTAPESLDISRRSQDWIRQSHLHVFLAVVPSRNFVAVHRIPAIMQHLIVNMLNIPVCCDCGIVCSHMLLEQGLRHISPSACQHSCTARAQRESIDYGSAFCARFIYPHNWEGRSWQTFVNGRFVEFDRLSPFPPENSSLHPGRKQLLWNTHSFLRTSSVSSHTQKKNRHKDRSGFGYCSVRPSLCLGSLVMHILHMCRFPMKTALIEPLRFDSFLPSPCPLTCLHTEHIEFVTGPRSYFHFSLGK